MLCDSGVEAWAVQGFDPCVASVGMPYMVERHDSLYRNKSIQEVDRDAKAGWGGRFTPADFGRPHKSAARGLLIGALRGRSSLHWAMLTACCVKPDDRRGRQVYMPAGMS